MSDYQRDSWRLVATSEPHYDRFGKLISISGWNLFCKRNILLFIIDQPVTVNPFTPPLLSPEVLSWLIFSISAPSISVFVNPFSSDFGFSLYFSAPKSTGISHRNVPVHLIFSFVGDGVGGKIDIASNYIDVYSNWYLKCLGQSIYVKLQIYHIPSGKILRSIYASIEIVP